MKTDLLTKKYPLLKIRNKTTHAQNLLYQNGDSVTIPPGAVSSISTAGLSQVPDQTVFTLISPSIADLVSSGIIEVKKVSAKTAPRSQAQPQVQPQAAPQPLTMPSSYSGSKTTSK